MPWLEKSFGRRSGDHVLLVVLVEEILETHFSTRFFYLELKPVIIIALGDLYFSTSLHRISAIK